MKWKKILSGIIFIIIYVLIIGTFYFALNKKDEIKKVVNTGEVIENYYIHVNINENNTYNVHEVVDKNFINEGYSFDRIFSLKNDYINLSGKQNKSRVKIKDFETKNDYDKWLRDDKFNFKISDSVLKKGLQKYDIKYTYDAGKDRNKNCDEIYYSLLGDYFDTDINKLNFEIKLPKSFNSKNLNMYIESNGIKDLNNIEYKIDGNVIKGKILRKLDAYEKIILRVKLPNNYFKGAGDKFGILDILFFVIPIFSAIKCLIVWIKYGKDKKIKEEKGCYPPENLNSLELAVIYQKGLHNNNIVKLLIDMANRGYLKIIETEDKNFQIIKLKEYTENNEIEKMFFEKLFEEKTIIKKEDLKYKFNNTFNKIYKKIIEFIKNKNIYHNINKRTIINLIILMAFSIFTIYVIPAGRYGMLNEKFNTINYREKYSLGIFGYVGIMFFAFYLWISVKDKRIIFISLIDLSLPVILLLSRQVETQMLLYEPRYLYGFILGMFCIIIMATCIRNMDKKTEEGNKILSKIEGFKLFLISVKKEELEKIVEKDPNYFYDMLPYVMTFKLTKKWLNKFKDIKIKEVDWYENYKGEKDIEYFIYKVYTKIENIMLKEPNENKL